MAWVLTTRPERLCKTRCPAMWCLIDRCGTPSAAHRGPPRGAVARVRRAGSGSASESPSSPPRREGQAPGKRRARAGFGGRPEVLLEVRGQQLNLGAGALNERAHHTQRTVRTQLTAWQRDTYLSCV